MRLVKLLSLAGLLLGAHAAKLAACSAPVDCSNTKGYACAYIFVTKSYVTSSGPTYMNFTELSGINISVNGVTYTEDSCGRIFVEGPAGATITATPTTATPGAYSGWMWKAESIGNSTPPNVASNYNNSAWYSWLNNENWTSSSTTPTFVLGAEGQYDMLFIDYTEGTGGGGGGDPCENDECLMTSCPGYDPCTCAGEDCGDSVTKKSVKRTTALN